ncbi:hypothetical protein VNI00_000478 [Paramarasmius palmivorus]|uniref:Protein-S-isoprenylcysteine O-methyltransferase n=1 Tax=Paramarasmius palmivorus TaxID=297713 RepID=A0AAW0EB01_9AGAR
MSYSYEAVLKASLFLLSAVSFTVICTPPNGLPSSSLPPRPSFKSPSDIFSAKMREWVLLFAALYVLPLEVKLYWLASLNEAIYILRTESVHLSPLFLVTAFLSIAGGFIRYLCYRTLAGAFTFELVPVGERCAGPDPDGKKKSAKLVTNGPYAIVRHPSYTGMALNVVGCARMHFVDGVFVRSLGTWAVFLAAIWVLVMGTISVLLAIRATEEDEVMQKQFGEEWEQWQERVSSRAPLDMPPITTPRYSTYKRSILHIFDATSRWRRILGAEEDGLNSHPSGST